MNRLLRENGLSIVLFGLFLVFWASQLVAGRHVNNAEREKHGEPPLPLGEYVFTPHALEATAENWESEFLQMCAFVLFTAFLVQRGSAESRDPDEKEEGHVRAKVPPDAPWPVRRGGWMLRIYEHSLSLALGLLFLISFGLHAYGGVGEHNEQRAWEGEDPISAWEFMSTSDFWFQSFQNWQSEFLSIGAMVILSIFLREKDSPESKRLETPHHGHD